VYTNLKKAISFLLPINGGEQSSLNCRVGLLGLALPITALQIPWVQPGQAPWCWRWPAFETAEADSCRSPRRSGETCLECLSGLAVSCWCRLLFSRVSSPASQVGCTRYSPGLGEAGAHLLSIHWCDGSVSICSR